MLGKYTRIEKVITKEGKELYLLVGYDCLGLPLCDLGVEVELENELMFNGDCIKERLFCKKLTSVYDILDFCKEHSIEGIDKYFHVEKEILVVGDRKNFLIYKDLSCNWGVAVDSTAAEKAKPLTEEELVSLQHFFDNPIF